MRQRSRASSLRAIIASRLFEVFIREVLQNSLDASRDAQKVTVRFSRSTINEPGQRGLFLEGVGWSKLKERVAAANRVRNARLEPPEYR